MLPGLERGIATPSGRSVRRARFPTTRSPRNRRRAPRARRATRTISSSRSFPRWGLCYPVAEYTQSCADLVALSSAESRYCKVGESGHGGPEPVHTIIVLVVVPPLPPRSLRDRAFGRRASSSKQPTTRRRTRQKRQSVAPHLAEIGVSTRVGVIGAAGPECGEGILPSRLEAVSASKATSSRPGLL